MWLTRANQRECPIDRNIRWRYYEYVQHSHWIEKMQYLIQGWKNSSIKLFTVLTEYVVHVLDNVVNVLEKALHLSVYCILDSSILDYFYKVSIRILLLHILSFLGGIFKHQWQDLLGLKA